MRLDVNTNHRHPNAIMKASDKCFLRTLRLGDMLSVPLGATENHPSILVEFVLKAQMTGDTLKYDTRSKCPCHFDR